MKRIVLILALIMMFPVYGYSQGLPLKDGDSSTLADIAACGSLNCLQTSSTTTPTAAGYVKQADKDGIPLKISKENRISAGQDSLLFQEVVDGAVVNTRNWVQSQATMTQAIASGFLVLNTGAISTINTYSIITSTKSMPLYTEFANHFAWLVKTPNIPQANATMELGFGFVATTAAPTGSGAYFRWGTDGTFKAVVNWSGTEILSSTLSNPSINTVHAFDIFVNHLDVTFYVDDVLVATVVPGGNAVPMVPAHIPMFARVYTGGTIPSDAPQLFVSLAMSIQRDINNNKKHEDSMAGMWRGSYVSQTTAYLSTANHANSTSPTSATLSNTAAGYTTLGGRWQFAAIAGAATDYALFGFQVPTGFTLNVSNVCISSVNTVVAVATTPTTMDWGVGIESSAVSLATADSPPTTFGPIRIPIGIQSYTVGLLAGATVPDICREFRTPLVVDSGRFFHVILQMPTATATATEIFRGDVVVNGYFE